jgi:YHS domain-containing protein
MKNLLTVLAVAGAMSTLASAPYSHDVRAAATAKARVAKCPKCKMTLSTKKDKMHNTALKINGKTYYCCSACKDHKAPAAKTAAKMTAAAPKCPVCKMHTVGMKKDAAHPHAVNLNGKTYYSCCKQG